MSIDNSYAADLKALKKKLKNNNMSVLIGAGFSKNFNQQIFPDWWELIFAMVREGLEIELKDRYKQLFPLKKSSGKEYEKFLKERIEKYIENIGPLEAVSEFIRRKGFREAVDFRIENQTPYISTEDEIRFINYNEKGKQVKRKVTEEELSVHKKLVTLPWINIYTTNYDNLLEESFDIKVSADFDTSINELEGELEEDRKILNEGLDELKKLESESIEFQDQVDKSKSTSGTTPVDPGIGHDDASLKELENKIATRKRITDFQKDEIGRKELRLSELKYQRSQVTSVVTYSSELAIKKTGNIVKLHGSIRTPSSEAFGFDNDASMQYVISKEDFDEYPLKHQAFTQLMRISLLQESFCLIGFSGIDPNFLAWIGWVRDIIEKKQPSDIKEIKIFLIDVGTIDANPERNQFYINHRISFIPLGHKDSLKFLVEETGLLTPAIDDKKALVNLFLDYLNFNARPNSLMINVEKFQQEKYLKLWAKYGWKAHSDGSVDNFSFFEKRDEYKRLRKYNRIPANSYNLGARMDVIQLLPYKMETFKDSTSLMSGLITFITQVLQETPLQLRYLFAEDVKVFYKLMRYAKHANHESYPYLLLIDLKDAVWDNDLIRFGKNVKKLSKNKLNDVLEEIKYLQVLSCCFNLRYEAAKGILDYWQPKGHWSIKKAALLALINPNESLQSLRGIRQENAQETLYQLELEILIGQSVDIFQDLSHLREEIKYLKDEGIRSSDYNLEELLRQLNKKR